MGVEAISPPMLVVLDQAPTANDTDFNLGTLWVDTLNDAAYLLTNLDGGTATWTQIASSTGTLLDLDADSGNATPSLGTIDIAGGTEITTSATGSTVTVGVTNGSNGQVMIGGGADAAWANLASSGGSVTITNTANGINLEAAGVAALTSLDSDSGTATPVAGVITIAGGTNITTAGAAATLTINLDASPSVAGSLTSGTTIASGTTITCGTGLTVSAGGIDSTGTTTLQDLGDGVVLSSAAGVLSDSAGNNGQVLLGSTGSTPAWASITSSAGTVALTEGANTLNLETTSVLPINVQTGTTYTLVLSDVGKLVTLDNGSSITLTVPLNASVAYDTGTQILLEAKGAGTVSVTPAGGVTLNSRGAVFDSAGQYAMMNLVKIGTDLWVLSGDIA